MMLRMILIAAAVTAGPLGAAAMEGKGHPQVKAECETDGADAQARAPQQTVPDSNRTASVASDRGTTGQASGPGGKEPTEVVKDIVANAKPAEGGQMVAETGRARPVESWFGCPPK